MEPIEQKAVIDRIEDGALAVLLIGVDETERVIPVDQLPEGATEGSWLRVQLEENVITAIAIDVEETDSARSRIASKMERLRQRKRHFKPIIPDEKR